MKTNKNINQEEWNALAQKYFGNNSADEEKALTSKLKAFNTADLVEFDKTAEQIDLYHELKRFDSTKAYGQVKQRIGRNQKRFIALKNKNNLLKIAAAIVFAFIIGSVWYFVEPQKIVNPKSSEVSVNDYGISNVELPDGSLVTLNRDTKINYPDEFSKNIREVYIEGEAFFEVVPNPNKPFIIHAGDASIKVLGTSFNVSAYPGNQLVEVVVATGKVQVYREETELMLDNDLILDPGEKGIFVNASKELLKITNEDLNYMAWKTRHLIFRDTSIKEVISQLSKLYRIQIKINGSEIEKLKYTGHFENQSVDFILEVISLTLGIEVDKEMEYYLLKKES